MSDEAIKEKQRTQDRQDRYAKYVGDDKEGNPIFVYGEEAAKVRRAERAVRK